MSEDTLKKNCINLTSFSNNRSISIKACLDSGNTLKLPAISLTFFNRLKTSGMIPKDLKLKRSNLTIKSADNSTLSVAGRINYPLMFTHPTEDILNVI